MNMEKEEKKENTETKQENISEKKDKTSFSVPNRENSSRNTAGRKRRGRGSKRGPRKDGRARPEFDNKIVGIRRVTRVVAGGRRFSFSVALVAGDRKGRVGFGQGKSTDTPLAIEKALRDAKKNMIKVNTTKDMSIAHEIKAKYGASQVLIMPAPGKGILAGSSVRTVLELAGLNGINAKIISGSKNQMNNAKAAISALKMLKK